MILNIRHLRLIIYSFLTFSIALLVFSLYLYVSISKMSPLFWKYIPLQRSEIHPEIDNCYTVYHGMSRLSSHQGPSMAQIYEDGIRLGPGNSLHDDIRTIGKGRFSFWHDYVYFSTSNNSDPRTNGKSYEIYAPVAWPRTVYWLTVLTWLGLFVFLVLILLRKTVKLWIFSPNALFIISLFAVTITFLVTWTAVI